MKWRTVCKDCGYQGQPVNRLCPLCGGRMEEALIQPDRVGKIIWKSTLPAQTRLPWFF